VVPFRNFFIIDFGGRFEGENFIPPLLTAGIQEFTPFFVLK
jgi:hypothetical protein